MDGQIPGAAVGDMPGEQRLGLGMQSGYPASSSTAGGLPWPLPSSHGVVGVPAGVQ